MANHLEDGKKIGDDAIVEVIGILNESMSKLFENNNITTEAVQNLGRSMADMSNEQKLEMMRGSIKFSLVMK